MKYLIMTAALAFTNAAYAEGPIQYPADATPAAIAANEAVRASIAGKPGPEYCLQIDTRDPHGKCLLLINLNAGGPGIGVGSVGGVGSPQ
jgi:hypothetical protein